MIRSEKAQSFHKGALASQFLPGGHHSWTPLHPGSFFAIFAVPISQSVENMLKSTIFIATLFLLATSCSSVRPAASRPPASTPAENTPGSTSSSKSVQFINNISIKPDARQDKTHSSITSFNKDVKAKTDRPAGPIQNYPALQL